MSNENANSLQITNLLVPCVLYGSSRGQSHRQWKRIAKKAAKTGSWEAALVGVEFMPLDDVRGDFSCNNSNGLLFEGENLWLDDTFEILFHVTADKACSSNDPDAWAKLLEKLTVSGLDYFWFSLCLCVAGVGIVRWRDRNESRRTACLCLEKLLRWWPQICTYDRRFSLGQKTGDALRGWSGWSSGLCGLCIYLGAKREEILRLTEISPQEAGKVAAGWLE